MDPGAAFRPAELARQRDFLCRLARGLLCDAARAEDVVQDAFVLALERPPREERALAAWLGRGVRRLSLNELRRSERARQHEGAAARPEGQDSHAEAAANLDAQNFVLAAVRALEEPYKTTIWLRYYEDLLPSAIAAREGLPVKTVKTRLSRALERLRAELDRSSGGDRAAWGALLLPLARRGAQAPIGVGPGILGGMLAMKKLVAVLVVLACVLLTWRAIGSDEPSPRVDARVAAAQGREASAARSDPTPEAAPLSVPARAALAVGREGSGREHASAGATLVVHAAFERDGTDAAGIGLVLVPHEDSQPDLRTVRAWTDPGGRARFEGCAPGPYSVHTDRRGTAEVRLSAGTTEELEVVIAAGVDVAGVVVDRLARPVPGAEIWLSRVSRFLGDGWLAGDVVARADSEGTFFLRSIGPKQDIGAFAPGFAPALLEELEERSWTPDDPRVRVTLVLEREGALLEGRVVDELGAPVPLARVAFGYAGMPEIPHADGRFGRGPTPRAVTSDELGRFRADWLEQGTTPVFVLAEGFALAHVEAAASSANAEPVVVALARGATLTGSVRDAAGQPVSGAEVSVLHAGDLDGCPFSLPRATSSAEGAFRLEHVPAGEITLSARLASDPGRRARATRTITEGAVGAWDLVLEAMPTITGRAVNDAGRGLARWTLMAGSGSVMIGLETDDDGRFVLAVRDPAEAWTLELLHAGVSHDRAEGVHAGDVVELVGRDSAELGRVEGGFVDAAGRVPDGGRVVAQLVSEASPSRPSVDLAGGRFLFEGVSPGRGRVRILSADRLLAESEAFELTPGAIHDVGLLSSQPAGSLLVEFVAPPGVALPEGCAYVSRDGEGTRALVRRDGEWRADDLDPGRGYLATYFPGLAMQQASFEVQARSETRLSVVLERGVERTLVFVPPLGTTCPMADVLVRCQSWELSWPAHGGEELAATLMLAPETYEIEATTSVGLSARGVLVIPDLLLERARVLFDLR